MLTNSIWRQSMTTSKCWTNGPEWVIRPRPGDLVLFMNHNEPAWPLLLLGQQDQSESWTASWWPHSLIYWEVWTEAVGNGQPTKIHTTHHLHTQVTHTLYHITHTITTHHSHTQVIYTLYYITQTTHNTPLTHTMYTQAYTTYYM